MTDHVDALLKLWRSTPFVWGARDCMLSLGDYVATRGVRDVTGYFRGRYTNEVGALAHVTVWGGIAGIIGLTGIPTTDAPERGDVVAFDPGGGVPIGAVCTGGRIAARMQRGVIEVDMRLIKIVQAWKVP